MVAIAAGHSDCVHRTSAAIHKTIQLTHWIFLQCWSNWSALRALALWRCCSGRRSKKKKNFWRTTLDLDLSHGILDDAHLSYNIILKLVLNQSNLKYAMGQEHGGYIPIYYTIYPKLGIWQSWNCNKVRLVQYNNGVWIFFQCGKCGFFPHLPQQLINTYVYVILIDISIWTFNRRPRLVLIWLFLG